MKKLITTILTTLLFTANVFASSTYNDDINYRTRVIKWYSDYDCVEYTHIVSIPHDFYNEWKNEKNRPLSSTQYIHYINEINNRFELKNFAVQMQTMAEERGLTDYQLVVDITNFVQSIPYENDLSSTGQIEYPKYPAETLYDYCGDCEDKAILLAGILRECGFDVVWIQLKEHIIVGVAGDLQGTNVVYNGTTYYTLDGTSPGWKIGQLSSRFTEAYNVIKVE